MAGRKAVFILIAAVATIAGAPAREVKSVIAKKGVDAPAMESDEQIVADFLARKDRAEKAQRAILARLRKDLDLKRAEFDRARKSFDEARGLYEGIVGPLPRQGAVNPADPRLPYEFEVRRTGLDSKETRLGTLSTGAADPSRK